MFKGQGLIQITGRRPYKGVMPPDKAVILGQFEKIDEIMVDTEMWYTVQVTPRVTKWIKEQNNKLWHEHRTASHYKVLDTFDVQEKLYTQLILTWGS